MVFKSQKKSQDREVDGMIGAIEKLDEISNRAARIPKEDSYDHFGKYISSMLRSIGPPRAVRLQEKFVHLISQEMCPPLPTPPLPSPQPCMSSSVTPSHSALSDYSDDYGYEYQNL